MLPPDLQPRANSPKSGSLVFLWLLLIALIASGALYGIKVYYDSQPENQLKKYVGKWAELRAGSWLGASPAEYDEAQGYISSGLTSQLLLMAQTNRAVFVTAKNRTVRIVGVSNGKLMFSFFFVDQPYYGPPSVIESTKD